MRALQPLDIDDSYVPRKVGKIKNQHHSIFSNMVQFYQTHNSGCSYICHRLRLVMIQSALNVCLPIVLPKSQKNKVGQVSKYDNTSTFHKYTMISN